MRQRKTIYTLLLAAMTLLASCKNDSYSEVTLYNDATITGFTLGTTTRNVNGQTVTVNGSEYAFQINQMIDGELKTRVIENRDSLPVGTKRKSILCTLTTVNNSWVGIVDLEDPDIIWQYISSDSIDFSVPRKFMAYASDGSGYTEYTVKVNVHQEDGDLFVWKRMDETAWPQTSTPTLPADIRQLIGSSTKEQYAIGTDGKLKVLREGMTIWEDELMENPEDADKLPTNDISLVSYPMELADNTDHVVMAGNYKTEEIEADGSVKTTWHAVVWSKIADYSKGAPKNHWTYMERESSDRYQLPVLTGLQLLRYDNSILAFGGDYKTIYQSRDNGITWKENKYYTMPADFNYETTGVTVVLDKDNYIWLYCDGTKEIWRGRLNRLGWQK